MNLRHRGVVAFLAALLAAGLIVGASIAEADKSPAKPTAKKQIADKADKGIAKKAAKQESKAEKAPQKEEAEEELTELQKLMRKKLDSSLKMLEGLAVEDFDLIKQGADELGDITKAEQWRVSNDAMYRQHSQEFRSKAFQASRMAKKSNLEGAALSYVQVTLSCVECHKWVRAVLLADTDLKDIGAKSKLAGVR